MISGGPIADSEQGFVPLASLLRKVAPEHLNLAQQRIQALGRDELVDRFHETFANGRRLAAYLLSIELTWRGVPPCFRHEYADWGGASLNQRYDLLMADLIWMRRWYPEHVKVIRYRRCKLLLTGNDTQLHQEAEFAYWAGRRPAWKLVGSLSLTEHQQWDCAWLRSTPIKKKAALIDAVSSHTMEVLRADLQSTRRTASFGEHEAEMTLRRRYALWRCARIVGEGSPSAIAARYTQLTGDLITRQLAAKHLEKTRLALARSKLDQ